ncbi:hypothetical protein MAR_015056, partial [Mya arenaria]
MEGLTISTWNCTGIMSSASCMNDLLLSYNIDIVGISEHWLLPRNAHFISSVNTNYLSHIITDSDLNIMSNRKVGKGGVALLWKRELNYCINTLDIDSDNIVGIHRETLIDHVIVNCCDNVKSCAIIEDTKFVNVSSHRPIVFCLEFNVAYNRPPPTNKVIINWQNVKTTDLEKYTAYLESSEIINLAMDFIIKDTQDIDLLYEAIVLILNLATDQCIPRVKYKPFIKPYWNDELTSLHEDIRHNRDIWDNAGRPRAGSDLHYVNYKISKANFRRTHREAVDEFLKQQESNIDRAAALDNNEFWRLIKRRHTPTTEHKSFEMKFSDKTVSDPVDIFN